MTIDFPRLLPCLIAFSGVLKEQIVRESKFSYSHCVFVFTLRFRVSPTREKEKEREGVEREPEMENVTNFP